MLKHAVLSASGAERWLNCPPSVRFEEEYGTETTSAYAEEGTKAHQLAEAILSVKLRRAVANHKRLIKEADPEMLEFITGYCNTVLALFNAAKKRHGAAAVIILESRLDFSPWVIDGFGTGDVVIMTPEDIHVIDLKYGKGVPVYAYDNPQLKLYGLGACNVYGCVYNFEKVRTTIIQPRLDNTSDAEYDIDDLLAWGEDIVKPIAVFAYEGAGDFSAGDHCRFCKANAVCTHRSQAHLDFAEKYIDKKTLTDDEVTAIILNADKLTQWLDDIKNHALQKALFGYAWPGLKVVEGRSNRKYSDDLEVLKTLVAAGIPEVEVTERNILSISKLEKALGTKKVQELIGGLIYKPPGKPVLVPVEDKRPAFDRLIEAQQDFNEKEIS